MSGNGSYIKSINGIVSFDSGVTTIEGDAITTGTIDSTTINCSSINATSEVNTSFIYVDFLSIKAATYITFISDVLFDYNLYASSIWSAGGSGITLNNNTGIVGELSISSGLTTKYVEALQGLGGTPQTLKLGQDHDFTSEVRIGRAEFTLAGFTFPEIPPRTTFYAVGNDDLANKLYVDTATAGTNILSLTNTFTGTSNTFNNLIKTSQIDSVTPSATYDFLTSHTGPVNIASVSSVLTLNSTGPINIGSSSSVITLGSTSTAVRGPYVPLISTDLCNKLYVDSVAGRGTDLLSSTNTWTGTNTFNNTISASKINVTTPASAYELLENLTGNLNIANNQLASVINIGQNKTSGWILLGSALCTLIMKGQLSCEKNITMGNSTSTSIYSNTGTAPFEIRGDNTLNVIGSLTSKFGSWNGGQVELGTQSFSNILIGAGGTGANLRTTTIKGTLIAEGSGGIAAPLWGLLSFVTTNVNYTIVLANINIDFYLTISGINPRTITMPARRLGQKIHIRSLSAVSQLLTCVGSSGNFVNPNNNTPSVSYSLPSAGSVNYFDNGTDLIAF